MIADEVIPSGLEAKANGRRPCDHFKECSMNSSWAVLLSVSLICASGCGSREPVVQVGNLRYIQLMQTAVSARDADKVDKVVSAAREQHEANAMSEGELAVLMQIGLLAKDAQWDDAETACRSLAEGQQWRRRN
jgi:hypothetical protein